MAAKRSRKARKQEQKRLKNTPPGHLLEQGRQRLDKGDARGALELLKLAQRGDSQLEGLPLQIFLAYRLRALQLAEKNMAKEAAAMRELAVQYQDHIHPAELTAADLAQYIDHLSPADALRTYGEYLGQREPAGAIERKLADLLVAHRCWEALAPFAADHPLCRDAATLQQAMASMDAGDWKQANAQLKGIGRHSLYAPWRLFCKGMVCFGEEDDAGLRQVLDLLPEDFILARTVAVWKHSCVGKPAEPLPAASLPVAQVLGTAQGAVVGLAAQLRQAIRKRQLRDAERLLSTLAEAVYPEDPPRACLTLLQIVGLAAPHLDDFPRAIHSLAHRLLPHKQASRVISQIDLQLQEVGANPWDVQPAAAYLSRLEEDFPEPRTQSLARARVLESLARTGRRAGIMPYWLPPPVLQTLARLIGESTADPGTIFADLMAASLEADPDNRDGYRFLLDLLRGHTDSRPRVESILNDMADRFPDDPQPCLELATHHYGRNAYRKAEAALNEARKRAPHDERILDLQAIGQLKSADQNRKRSHFERAAEALEKAAQLGRSRLAELLSLKRLMLEIVSSGTDAAALVAPHLESLPPLPQLRSLILLIHDLQENDSIKNVRPEMAASLEQLLERKAELLDRLTPDEIVALLAPLEEDFAILFDFLEVAAELEDHWPSLLQRVDGDALLTLLDILLDDDGWDIVHAEVDRRLRETGKAKRDPFLLFYLAVIRYEEGQDHDSRRFQEVIEKADAAQQERLRAIALHLSGCVDNQPLSQALREFRFEGLNALFPFGRPFGGGRMPFDRPFGGGQRPFYNPFGGERMPFPLAGFAEEDEDDEWDEDEEPDLDFGALLSSGDDLLDLLDGMERMIDEGGLRNMPVPLIRELAGLLRSKPQARQELARLARECEGEGLAEELSRELYTILFPHKRRK